MDQVVKCAETNHIGLIPSLFWHLGTVAELMGEEPSRLGDPNSKSIAYIKQYTTEMVQRYNGSPAIWGWEFGNEANLGVDLPRRSGREAPAEDRSEAPPVRLATAQLRNAYMAFARAVRRIDPWRTIDSGTSIPRPAGWHNAMAGLGSEIPRSSPTRSCSNRTPTRSICFRSTSTPDRKSLRLTVRRRSLILSADIRGSLPNQASHSLWASFRYRIAGRRAIT